MPELPGNHSSPSTGFVFGQDRPTLIPPGDEYPGQEASKPTAFGWALAAPETIITIPEATLLAFAEHCAVGELLPTDGGDAEQVLALFKQAGIDEQAVASELQREGTETFDKSWADLMDCLAAKSRAVSSVAT
jgi:transaldolase